MNISTEVRRFFLPERRTERMTGLVTPSTRSDWEIIKKKSPGRPMSMGDLFTLAVWLITNHPEIIKIYYELREKE